MNPKQTKDKIDSYHKEGKITYYVSEKAKEVVDELEKVGITDIWDIQNWGKRIDILLRTLMEADVDIIIKENSTTYDYSTMYQQNYDLPLTPESFKDIAKLLNG